VLQQQGVTDELQQARLGAMLGTAVADAGIAAWETKYLPFPTGTLWRSNNAIQDCNGWNALFTTCDPTWTSSIATPPHPDYVAGHPTFSQAAATVLAGHPHVGEPSSIALLGVGLAGLLTVRRRLTSVRGEWADVKGGFWRWRNGTAAPPTL
jgi:hypothetical protein